MNWLLLNSGECAPAFNMALDEALLGAAARLGKPVLRFYGWTELAATFGYFQKYAEVERATPLRPLIRRPTGGGIVPHDADWTYALVFPPGHEWCALKAEESYRRVHEWLQAAFAKLKVATELAPTRHPSLLAAPKQCEGGGTRPSSLLAAPKQCEGGGTRPSSLPAACFVGHVKFDLLWNGRKIAGAAQRRNKLGLLIQGSVQPSILRSRTTAEDGPPISLARTDWQKAVCDAGQVAWGIEWSDFKLDPPLRERVEFLTRQKYSLAAYNHKR